MATPDPFQKLGRLYLDGFDLVIVRLRNDFRVFANAYFNRNRTPNMHDNFFNRFTPVWLDLIGRRKYFQAIKLWNFALGLALEWQKQNKPIKIHKGTPFYFLGVTAILNNELENGFLSMHQALKEDYRLSGGRIPQTPAFWFVTLDSSRQGQFFRLKVEQIAGFLSEKLERYCTDRGGSLDLSNFRRRFLTRRAMRDEVFFFVYLLFMLRKIEVETDKIYKRNIFSSLLNAKVLFDFCRITERVINCKNPARSSGFLGFKNEILFLSSVGIPSLSLTRHNLTNINNDFNSDFSKTMYDIILGRYSIRLTDLEKDFAVAYGIRNLGAHEMRNLPVLYYRLPEIAQSILNTTFLTVENLY